MTARVRIENYIDCLIIGFEAPSILLRDYHFIYIYRSNTRAFHRLYERTATKKSTTFNNIYLV